MKNANSGVRDLKPDRFKKRRRTSTEGQPIQNGKFSSGRTV